MSQPATAANVAEANRRRYWHDKHLCTVTKAKQDKDGRVYIEWTEATGNIFCAGSFQPNAYFGEEANI